MALELYHPGDLQTADDHILAVTKALPDLLDTLWRIVTLPEERSSPSSSLYGTAMLPSTKVRGTNALATHFDFAAYKMSSIVLELQAQAMDADTNLGNLLRKSLAVATKLQLTEWIAWCKSELNGYSKGENVPGYRVVEGELKMFNPYNGIWMQCAGLGPIKSACSQSIAEIQDLVNSEGMICQNIPPENYSWLTEIITPPKLILQKTSFVGMLDAIRNTILEWTLKLESDGVLGEGMTFSLQEKKSVMKNETNYHIGAFSGVLGNISGGSVQIGDYNQIEAQLEAAGVPGQEREKLKQLMHEFPKAILEKKANIVEQGIAWSVRNAANLGALSNSIREWFQ